MSGLTCLSCGEAYDYCDCGAIDLINAANRELVAATKRLELSEVRSGKRLADAERSSAESGGLYARIETLTAEQERLASLVDIYQGRAYKAEAELGTAQEQIAELKAIQGVLGPRKNLTIPRIFCAFSLTRARK